MSTKIYNGYKINISNFYDLRIFCEELGQKIIKKREQLITKRYCDLITEFIVGLLSGKRSQITNYPIFDSMEFISKRVNKIIESNQYDPLNDFEFAVTFIPIQNKILCLLYTERKEFKEIWENQSEIEDYHYQNQTDPPEDVNEIEWRQREEDWDKALTHDIPSYSGFSFEPKSTTYLVTTKYDDFDNLNDVCEFYSKCLIEDVIIKEGNLYKLENFYQIFKKLKELRNLDKYEKKRKRIEKKLKFRLQGWESVRLSKYTEIMKVLMWLK